MISRPSLGGTSRDHKHDYESTQGLLGADAQTFRHGIRARMRNVSKYKAKHHEAYASPHAHRHHRGPTPFRNNFTRSYHGSSNFSRVRQHTHCRGSRLQQSSNLLTLSQNDRRHRSCSIILGADIPLLQDPEANYLGSGPAIHRAVYSTTLHHFRDQSEP